MAPALADQVLLTLPLAQLTPSPLNPRKKFDQADLEDLAKTMAPPVGVIEPLIVRAVNGSYELVAGERRWRAAAVAQLETVPVIVKALTDAQVLELMLIENKQRKDLNALEEADGYKRLLKFGFDIDKVAARIGFTRKYIYDRIKLLELIPAAQTLLLDNRMTPGHAILLARLKPEDQKRAINVEVGGLFAAEDTHGLFRPDESHGSRAHVEQRTVSVREFEGWINEHIRLDLKSATQLQELFPETAQALETAETVVHITLEHYLQTGQGTGMDKIVLAQDWKRADGLKGSKTCPTAVTGVIVVGAGRGDAFKVCVTKRCKVHFPPPKKNSIMAQSAARVEQKTDRDKRWEAEAKRRRAREQKENETRMRWKAAAPAIATACIARVRDLKLPVLAELASRGFRTHHFKKAAAALKPKTAEDLVRAYALAELLDVSSNAWNAVREFPKLAKRIGLDLRPLLTPKAVAKSSAQPSTARGKKMMAKATMASKKR